MSEEYNKKGDLSNAIKYSKKTLEVYKELQEDKHISTIENNLGKLFYEFDNIEESFKHFEIAKDIRIRSKDIEVINTLINICENYIKLKDLDKCEGVLNEIASFVEDGNVEQLVEYKLLWYRVYTIRERYVESESILIETFNLAKSSKLDKKAAQIAIMIGKFYIDNKKDSEAAKYLDQGVTIFKDLGILNN